MDMSLGEQYPLEQARLRQLLLEYKEIGPSGAFAYMMIEQVLKRADEASMSQDITRIMASFLEMRECK